jgi:Pyridoxamine 5'-phosphate oxidase
MLEPKSSHPHWPDALSNAVGTTSALKSWSWALQRLESSHNYWIATSRPDGRPHLMLVWGIWWQDAFWFSTGPRTRKAKNLASNPRCAIGTEKADEAVILEGSVEEVADRAIWKQLVEVYNRKYGGDVGPLLESSGGSIYRVIPQTVFGQDEHAENFTEAVTRWTFTNS